VCGWLVQLLTSRPLSFDQGRAAGLLREPCFSVRYFPRQPLDRLVGSDGHSVIGKGIVSPASQQCVDAAGNRQATGRWANG
jgi:hypothetical protein